MTPFYGGSFEDPHSVEDLFQTPGALTGARVVAAAYDNEGYGGEAFVLFERDGQLFEVNASHCSCYGLEDSWDPEETSVEAILRRLDTWGGYGPLAASRDEIRKAVLSYFQGA